MAKGGKQMNIGEKIIEIRKERKMTQEDFAKIFHVTRQTVSNWEHEKSCKQLFKSVMNLIFRWISC